MKEKIPLTIILLSMLVLGYSCNSSGYGIEKDSNTEAPKTETRTEIKQDIEQPKAEIKQEINKETITLSKSYTVQIGAFRVESNAKVYSENARKLLNLGISYIQIDGLYKVRVGHFNSKSEALLTVSQIKAAGFDDFFISELNN
jgi:cell division protein FtsN